MKTQTCRVCGHEGVIGSFPPCGTHANGDQRYRTICYSCHRKANKERKQQIREQINTYKNDLKCNRCGYEDSRALQFHHIDDNKEFSICDAPTMGYSWEKIQKEINKCEVLCANCHQIHHYADEEIRINYT